MNPFICPFLIHFCNWIILSFSLQILFFSSFLILFCFVLFVIPPPASSTAHEQTDDNNNYFNNHVLSTFFQSACASSDALLRIICYIYFHARLIRAANFFILVHSIFYFILSVKSTHFLRCASVTNIRFS